MMPWRRTSEKMTATLSGADTSKSALIMYRLMIGRWLITSANAPPTAKCCLIAEVAHR